MPVGLVFDFALFPAWQAVRGLVRRRSRSLLSACGLAVLPEKSQGTDLGKLIRRKRAPETPYYLRNAAKERKPRQGFAGARHVFDDDLSETAEEQSSVVPGNARNRAKAIALAINGVLMFVLSAL